MDELQTYQAQLPNTIQETVDFVVINEEKLNAVKAAIRLAKKTKDINLERLQRQQRELEITTVQAQVRLGELTRKIEKASGGDRKSEDFQKSNHRTFDSKKNRFLPLV